jgi:hypothetical protein
MRIRGQQNDRPLFSFEGASMPKVWHDTNPEHSLVMIYWNLPQVGDATARLIFTEEQAEALSFALAAVLQDRQMRRALRDDEEEAYRDNDELDGIPNPRNGADHPNDVF